MLNRIFPQEWKQSGLMSTIILSLTPWHWLKDGNKRKADFKEKKKKDQGKRLLINGNCFLLPNSTSRKNSSFWEYWDLHSEIQNEARDQNDICSSWTIKPLWMARSERYNQFSHWPCVCMAGFLQILNQGRQIKYKVLPF